MKASVVACLAALFLVGCGQADQEPAELATDYKNYVSFRLDSADWTAGSDGSLSAITEVVSVEIGDEPSNRSLMITAWKVEKGASSSISLYADKFITGQAIDLAAGSARASLTTKAANAAKPEFITSDAQHSGKLIVTSTDTVNRRVTGTFECTLGTHTISNGKFDARYTAPKPM
jgi:hypothetical protein